MVWKRIFVVHFSDIFQIFESEDDDTTAKCKIDKIQSQIISKFAELFIAQLTL